MKKYRFVHCKYKVLSLDMISDEQVICCTKNEIKDKNEIKLKHYKINEDDFTFSKIAERNIDDCQEIWKLKAINKENSLKINFEPIEDLEKIKVLWKTKIELDSLPFFKEYYNGIFKSLIIFRLYIGIVSINNIIYLFKNIDNMPNLKEFEFICECDEIELEEYNKCIIKLLSLNLDSIEFKTDPRFYIEDKYSFEELKNRLNY